MAKQLNLIIGFDRLNYNIKIMRVLGTDLSDVKVDYLPIEQSLFINGQWGEILNQPAINEYIANQHFDSSFAVFLVLPDSFVGTDLLTIPSIKKAKQKSALESQMRELYFFYPDYKYNYVLLDSNKSNTTYEVIMIKKNLLNEIYKALSENKLYIKNATYSANALINSCFALMPKMRKNSFVFMDIKAGSAEFVAVSKGETCGWSSVKYGYEVLDNPKVMIENNIIFNDIANVAVINATEKARKKKMTLMGVDEEDEEGLIEENAINVNEISDSSEELTEEQVQELKNKEAENAEKEAQEKEVATTVAEEIDTGEVVSENAENPTDAETSTDNSLAVVEPVVEAPKIKTYQRKIKKLPMFMQRPEPVDQDGVAFENFRLFVKHALLIKTQMEMSGHYAPPTSVIVNLPKAYHFVVDEINKEDNGIEFKLFEPNKDCNVHLMENLDLYGAMSMDLFNKNNNF